MLAKRMATQPCAHETARLADASPGLPSAKTLIALRWGRPICSKLRARRCRADRGGVPTDGVIALAES